jgi:glutamate:GABA antiporter
MTTETTQTTSQPVQLVRALKLGDLVLMNLVAVLGLRHLATSAKAGPVTLGLWVLAAIFFFVPQGLVVMELSSRFPNVGGIYDWTKRALGEGHGFLCGWCYWINNVLYYPSLLISAAVVATFITGEGDSKLGDNSTYVISATLVMLWIATAVNIFGVRVGKWLQNIGGIGTYIPGILIILVGIYGVLFLPAANSITANDLIPKSTDYDSLNLWAYIAFAYAGLELSATMGGEVKEPRRTLPRSIFISAPLIAIIYILGTGSVLWTVPNERINVTSGFLQTIEMGMAQISANLWWVAPICAVLYTLGSLGGVGAWLMGPARVALGIGLDRYFPPAFGRVHPRWKTPYVAILAQTGLATLFLLIMQLGKETGVGQVYLTLLSAQLIIYYVTYIYLFIVFLIHRRREGVSPDVRAAPGGTAGAYAIGISGLLVTIFAMVLALVPPPGTENKLEYEVKVIGGVAFLILLGVAIYWRARSRATPSPPSKSHGERPINIAAP